MSVMSTANLTASHMDFAHFIGDNAPQDRLSRPIVISAVLGIVMGMAVITLTEEMGTRRRANCGPK